MQQSKMEAGVFFTDLQLIVVWVQSQEQDEVLEDVVLGLVADRLAQEVQHPQVEIVLLDFPVAYLEVVEKRDDQALN